MSNPAHTWLNMKSANSQYMYADRGFSEECAAYHLALRELAKFPAAVVAAAEAEHAGQLTLKEVG